MTLGTLVLRRLQEVLDIEEIVKFGQSRTLCPYYMGRQVKQGRVAPNEVGSVDSWLNKEW